MKILAAAPVPDFDVYVARPETQWIQKGDTDSLAGLYDKGFLPYSGTKNVRDVWYSARSARVTLKDFVLTSENRRIARKFDGMFTKTRVSFDTFVPDEMFWDFCLTYFSTKHGPLAMPRARLELILSSGLIITIVIHKSGDKPIAYVLEVEDGAMGHYWYSFYDLSLAHQSLGLWLMLDAVRDAQVTGKMHYYLGTVYGEKALYKTNFTPMQWWDGGKWNEDVALLKELGRTD